MKLVFKTVFLEDAQAGSIGGPKLIPLVARNVTNVFLWFLLRGGAT